MKKRIIILFVLVISLLILFSSNVCAENITDSISILINGKAINNKIVDGKESTYASVDKDVEITITSDENIHGLYIVYEYSSKTGRLSNNGKTTGIGQNNFLHEYINVN